MTPDQIGRLVDDLPGPHMYGDGPIDVCTTRPALIDLIAAIVNPLQVALEDLAKTVDTALERSAEPGVDLDVAYALIRAEAALDATRTPPSADNPPAGGTINP